MIRSVMLFMHKSYKIGYHQNSVMQKVDVSAIMNLNQRKRWHKSSVPQREPFTQTFPFTFLGPFQFQYPISPRSQQRLCKNRFLFEGSARDFPVITPEVSLAPHGQAVHWNHQCVTVVRCLSGGRARFFPGESGKLLYHPFNFPQLLFQSFGWHRKRSL